MVEQSSFAPDAAQMIVSDTMFVKLNFSSGVSLKRTYSVAEQLTEQSIIETGLETPSTI